MIKNNKTKSKNQKSNPGLSRQHPWLLAISSLVIFLLSFLFLFFAGAQPIQAQICERTVYQTDQGLVYLEKGQKAKLLIGGIWYCCEGCGPSIPISSPDADCDNPQPATRPTTQLKPRPPKQELSDEQMIELIEKTRSLQAQIQAEDEARQHQEHFAFLDNVSLLSRELLPLENVLLPQFKGLKLKLEDLAEKATTINEMGNIARWSLIAAGNAKYGDDAAREMAGWGFDQWKERKDVIDLSSIAPEAPLPESESPQFKAFKYIAAWAADMRAKLLRMAERQYEYSADSFKLKDESLSIKSKIRYEAIPLTGRLTEEEIKKQEARAAQEKQVADLAKQAEALLKESEEMKQLADSYEQEINKMFKEFWELVKEPSKCSSFLQEHLVVK